MIKRYALTHVNEDGQRQLTRRNIGSNHFNTLEGGEEYLSTFLKANTDSDLGKAFGFQSIDTFEIREVDCHDHGDAIGIYFDDRTVAEIVQNEIIKKTNIDHKKELVQETVDALDNLTDHLDRNGHAYERALAMMCEEFKAKIKTSPFVTEKLI